MKNMTRTVTVPIPLAQQEVDVLRGIIVEYNLMWRMVVDWCREHQSANKTRLQKDMYHVIRENYPSMLSQFTSIALRDGAGAMKSWNSNNPKRKWQLNPQRRSQSVPMDLRLFSLRGNLLTIATSVGHKRIRALVMVPQWFTERYPEATVNAMTLHISRKGNVYAKMVFRLPAPQHRGGTVVGIDRGLYKIAVTSEGGEYTGAQIRAARRRFQHNRATLQSKGTRSAKRRLRAMSGREERFTRNINHVISKELASNPNVGTYVVEDLTGIRNQRRGKTMRKWMGQWAFAQLEFMLRYKCEAKGIEVVVVDAYFTSKRCNDCGDVDKRSRHKGVYRCVACGHKDNSDINAAKNIRDKHLLSPHAWGAGRLSTAHMDEDSKPYVQATGLAPVVS